MKVPSEMKSDIEIDLEPDSYSPMNSTECLIFEEYPPDDCMKCALFTSLCCTTPCSLIGLIHSFRSRDAFKQGRFRDAQKYARLARKFVIIGVFLVFLYLFFEFYAAFLQIKSNYLLEN